MSALHQATGLIIRKLRAKNNDQLLVIVTREFGKAYFVAKGAQKITSKRVAALDSFNMVRVHFQERHGFRYITSVDLISSLQSIKTDYQKRWQFIFIAEILDKLLPVDQREDDIFSFLKKFLTLISKKELDEKLFVRRANSLLALLGYHIDAKSPLTYHELKHYVQSLGERAVVSDQLNVG